MISMPALPPLRNLQEWRKAGVVLSTDSDEAAKMFDAYLYQKYGFFECDELGGCDGTLRRMYRADPEMTMAQILLLQTTSLEPTEECDFIVPDTASILNILMKKLSTVNKWEKTHIEAALAVSNGTGERAESLWQDCLAMAPGDLLAANQSFLYNLSHGRPQGICFAFSRLCQDSLTASPYYAFLRSRLAFGLTETNCHSEARDLLTSSLQHTPWDPWSHHSMAHIYFNLGEPELGLENLQSKRDIWSLNGTSLLTCHNFWHEAVFAWDLGDVDKILNLLDTELIPRVLKPSTIPLFPLSDLIALMLRLDYECLLPPAELQARWDMIYDRMMDTDRLSSSCGEPFYDIHIGLSLLAGRRPDKFEQYVSTLHSAVDKLCEEHDQLVTMNSAAWTLLRGAQKFFDGDYEGAATLLYHDRDKWYRLGGSRAQQDVFLWLLFYCLARCRNSFQFGRLKMLLSERMWSRRKSGAVNRLQILLDSVE